MVTSYCPQEPTHLSLYRHSWIRLGTAVSLALNGGYTPGVFLELRGNWCFLRVHTGNGKCNSELHE